MMFARQLSACKFALPSINQDRQLSSRPASQLLCNLQIYLLNSYLFHRFVKKIGLSLWEISSKVLQIDLVLGIHLCPFYTLLP